MLLGIIFSTFFIQLIFNYHLAIIKWINRFPTDLKVKLCNHLTLEIYIYYF